MATKVFCNKCRNNEPLTGSQHEMFSSGGVRLVIECSTLPNGERLDLCRSCLLEEMKGFVGFGAPPKKGD